MKPGIYYTIPEQDYRDLDAVSQSSLKPILRSPAHYKAGIEEEREDTASMILGRIVAQLLLEPDRDAWWTIKPDGISLSETAGKEWAKLTCGWNEEVDGKFPRSAKEALEKKGITIVSAEDYMSASRMATALAESKKPEVRDMLKNAKFEVSVIAEQETATGNVLCKSRPDIVTPGASFIADLKTTVDATQRAFGKTIERFRYDFQSGSYIKQWNAACKPGDERTHFLFLVIEKTAPFAHCVHHISGEWLARGQRDYENALNIYAHCKKLDDWPDYPAGIISQDIPKYLQ